MTHVRASAISLLIVDFDGVCTLSSRELVARGEVATLASIVRPKAERVLARAAELAITTVVLSNELSPSWIDEVPLLAQVDHVVVCADNRVYKPDRRAFQRCLLLTGAAAEQTLVVDDQPENVTVAASPGIETIRFDVTDPTVSWAPLCRPVGRQRTHLHRSSRLKSVAYPATGCRTGRGGTKALAASSASASQNREDSGNG